MFLKYHFVIIQEWNNQNTASKMCKPIFFKTNSILVDKLIVKM